MAQKKKSSELEGESTRGGAIRCVMGESMLQQTTQQGIIRNRYHAVCVEVKHAVH